MAHGRYNGYVAQPSLDRVRRFLTTFKTLGEAAEFLNLFSRKFGLLGGLTYSCTGLETLRSPAMEPTTVIVSFSPWDQSIGLADTTDFEGLLANANATEI